MLALGYDVDDRRSRDTVVAGISGYAAGRIAERQAWLIAHASGACIAVDLAAAHGAVDEHERRMVLRSLARAINPHFGKFPERASDIDSKCDSLAEGAIRGTVVRNGKK